MFLPHSLSKITVYRKNNNIGQKPKNELTYLKVVRVISANVLSVYVGNC